MTNTGYRSRPYGGAVGVCDAVIARAGGKMAQRVKTRRRGNFYRQRRAMSITSVQPHHQTLIPPCLRILAILSRRRSQQTSAPCSSGGHEPMAAALYA
jgi:hypothetical protein